MSRLVTPDFIYHARGEDVKGRENLKEWVSSDRSVFPDIRFTIVDSIAESKLRQLGFKLHMKRNFVVFRLLARNLKLLA